MSEPSVTFHRLEAFEDSELENGVVCSFETERFGYFQIGYNQDGTFNFPDEPDINMLREADQKYIERQLLIVWRMVFDVPAATGRFQ